MNFFRKAKNGIVKKFSKKSNQSPKAEREEIKEISLSLIIYFSNETYIFMIKIFMKCKVPKKNKKIQKSFKNPKNNTFFFIYLSEGEIEKKGKGEKAHNKIKHLSITVQNQYKYLKNQLKGEIKGIKVRIVNIIKIIFKIFPNSRKISKI